MLAPLVLHWGNIMRKFALAVAALAIGTVTASAADMAARPYVKAPAPIAAVYNWTGFYVGGHVGWGEAKQDWFLIQNAVGFGFSKDGVIAGGYAGYNWQLGSNFVLGAEFEGSWSDLQQGNVPCTIGQAAICRNDVNWLGSVRGRAGVAFNQVLFYAAGGWAFADASHDRQFLPLGGGPFTSGVSDTRDGWVAAVGVEWAFAGNWIGRVQYDHYDFGTKTYLIPALSNFSDTRVSLTVDTVRVGIGYKF
jgi:outer membrane immunogenic protein